MIRRLRTFRTLAFTLGERDVNVYHPPTLESAFAAASPGPTS